MIKKFARYYSPYKRLFALTLLCGMLVAALELLFPLAVNRVIDDLLPSGNWELIFAGGIGLFVLYLFNGGFHYVVTYWGHKLGISIETDMRTQLYKHLQEQPIQYFDDTKTGHLISRLTNDLMDIGEVAHHGPEELVIALMTLTGAFGIMFTISWELTGMVFGLVMLIIALTYYFGKKMSNAMSHMFGSIADFNARVENNITGIRVIKAFANEAFEKERFVKNNNHFKQTKLKSYKIMASHIASSQILMKILLLFVLVAGAWFVINGEVTYGEFMAFVLLTNVMMRPIQQLNAVIEMYPKGIAGFRRFLHLLEMESSQKEKPDAIDVHKVKGNVTYKNVSFSYGEGNHVLHEVNFSIDSGETVALIGPSGAGKTTIASLLPRFYDVNTGMITIDGIDIREMTISSLRENIGFVQQDVFLFDGTIRENIAYGTLDASEEEIWEAARRSHMADFIENLPEVMDTLIGERGVKLSGGQKQRLSIARTFLKNPPILVLDEATSALDTETEAEIQKALKELSHGRTTLIIAHRLATIQDADRIFVVTKKGIEEQGNHQELIRSGGSYSRMHQAQFHTL
ncbi:ATP-binding cassette subfamily B protein [Geomicrobium halophilum]|uniref:ATP-binding cassette subfamily B protein n=1 Tax=Geomicrobium halophilum TaxID=549000 RepID=A0A841PVX4_9BACL|nr:ABC transporter ATP-binding protein [Geomicrobium halophilum]MBB6451396.1 ATP-binding cassette subfamily B protein [Geomicrobium halophilum]